MRRSSVAIVVGLLCPIGACSTEVVDAPAGGLAVNVAPLALEDVEDACYSLEVRNEAGATVWSKSSICADRYGDTKTDITYIGTCDASDPNSDGIAEATVVLTIDGLYGAGGQSDPLDQYRNPCAAPYNPNGCILETTCRENADTPVQFNLTIMRDANQGFFDVAVNFDDVFCSAKVDCQDNNGGALRLVHDPVSGERVPSVVWALACTDGDPAGAVETSSHIYMSDLVLTCGATSWTIRPSDGPGNLFPNQVTPPVDRPFVQAMVFEGAELITNNGVDADKLYWNVALGLNAGFFVASTPACTLSVRAAASHGPLTNGSTPQGFYPFVDVSVVLNQGADITCSKHPLDGAAPGNGVRTAYTGNGIEAVTFNNVATRIGGGISTSALTVVCAPGFAGTPCEPLCTPGCATGACTTPNTCDCDDGFGGPTCEDPIFDGGPDVGPELSLQYAVAGGQGFYNYYSLGLPAAQSDADCRAYAGSVTVFRVLDGAGVVDESVDTTRGDHGFHWNGGNNCRVYSTGATQPTGEPRAQVRIVLGAGGGAIECGDLEYNANGTCTPCTALDPLSVTCNAAGASSCMDGAYLDGSVCTLCSDTFPNASLCTRNMATACEPGYNYVSTHCYADIPEPDSNVELEIQYLQNEGDSIFVNYLTRSLAMDGQACFEAHAADSILEIRPGGVLTIDRTQGYEGFSSNGHGNCRVYLTGVPFSTGVPDARLYFLSN